MRLSEEETRDMGEALAMLGFVVKRLGQRALIRLFPIFIFMAIGWANAFLAYSFGAAVATVMINHGLALAWWFSFRKYYRALRLALRARALIETCVWWERLGDGEEATRQMEEASRLTNELDRFSISI